MFQVKKEKMRLIAFGKQFNVIGCVDDPFEVMTEEEEAKFVKEKCDNLRAMIPLSDEEYEDTMVYNHYYWTNPAHTRRIYMNRAKEKAYLKLNYATVHKPFLDDFRLIKPLILKHPNLARRWNDKGADVFGNRPESIRNKMDGNWIHGEERAAGFTYEDWTTETAGATFKNWSTPEMGEIVSGVIAAYHKDGCFVEIGAKTWAFMPMSFLSLVPVTSAEEGGLNIGDEVTVKVLSMGQDTRLLRDWDCKFPIVSITEILRAAAMEEVEAKQRGDEGTEPLFEVVVEFFRPFGAVVRTTSGLPGMISTMDMGDLAGNTAMLGQTITVEVLSRFTNRELLNNMRPQGPAEFGLRFSYKNAATRELSMSVEEGEVVDGVVSAILPASIELKVPVGTQGANANVEVRKVDICQLPDWDIAEYFQVGDELKAYVISKEESTGEVRLSTRALDKPFGTVLTNKEKYNADAEENAKVYLEKSTQQKAAYAAQLEGLLEDTSGGKDSGLGMDDEDADLF
jgi:small subunit ribosomal protein S1